MDNISQFNTSHPHILLRCNSLPPEILRKHQNDKDEKQPNDHEDFGNKPNFCASLDSKLGYKKSLVWTDTDWISFKRMESESSVTDFESEAGKYDSLDEISKDFDIFLIKEEEKSLDLLKSIWNTERCSKPVEVSEKAGRSIKGDNRVQFETSDENDILYFNNYSRKKQTLLDSNNSDDSEEGSDKNGEENIRNDFFEKTQSTQGENSGSIGKPCKSNNDGKNTNIQEVNGFIGNSIVYNATNAIKDQGTSFMIQVPSLTTIQRQSLNISKQMKTDTNNEQISEQLIHKISDSNLQINSHGKESIPPPKPARIHVQNNNYSTDDDYNSIERKSDSTAASNRKWKGNSGYDSKFQENMVYENNYEHNSEFSDITDQYSDSGAWHVSDYHDSDLDEETPLSEVCSEENHKQPLSSNLQTESYHSHGPTCQHHHHCCHHHHHYHHFNHKQGCPADDGNNSHVHYHNQGSHDHYHGDGYSGANHVHYSRSRQQMMQITDMMETLAESAGFEIHDVTPDGNCMYRSVIDQLRMHGDLETTAITLRKNAVEYLKENPCHEDGTHLQEFLPSENWDDYLERMKKDGEWGDQIMLRGIAEVTGRRICIISAIGDSHNQITIQPSKAEADQSENIFLGHMDDFHYISLRPKNWQDTWFVNARNRMKNGTEESTLSTEHKTEEEDAVLKLPSPDELIDKESGLPFYHLSFIIRNVLNEKYLYTDAHDWEYWLKQKLSSKGYKTLIAGSIVEKLEVSVINTSPAKPSYSLQNRNQNLQKEVTMPDIYSVNMSVYRVIFDGRDATQKTEVIALLNDVHPGYLRLQPVYPMQDFTELTWLNGHIPCLNTSYFRNTKHAMPKKQMQQFSENNEGCNKSSIVLGFWAESWPECALNWLSRGRPSGWPNSQLIQEAINDGCIVIPVSHPMSKIPECEWQFSFVESEKRLALNISKSQRYCFHIFKVLVDFFTGNIKVLSTYFLKTVFFHVCEIIPKRQWRSQPAACIIFLLAKLLQCLRNRNLPHYFITENNIIDHFSSEDIEHLITRIEGVREFPALSTILLAENHGLPSVSLADRVLNDINHFKDHKNLYRSVIEVMVPTLFEVAQNYLKYNMYESATEAVKQAHNELKCSNSVNPSDDQIMQFPVFAQQFISSLTMPYSFWFCFFLDYFYQTFTTADLTRHQTGYRTIKEITEVDIQEGEFDNIRVPDCILRQSSYSVENIEQDISFMQEFCLKLYHAELYEENAYYLRCYIKMLKDKITKAAHDQNDTKGETTRNKEKMPADGTVQESSISENYQSHIVISTCNGILCNVLICLFHCYNNTNQVEMFQEYVEDLVEVCDREPNSSTYQSLANIWEYLGNRQRAQEALNKKQALIQ